jgi:hypothetical protein
MLPEIIQFAAEQNRIRYGSLQGKVPRNPRAYVISRGRIDRIILAVFNSFVVILTGIFFIQSLVFHYGYLPLVSAGMLCICGLLFYWLKKNPAWLFKVLIPVGLVNILLGVYTTVIMFKIAPASISAFGVMIFIALPASAILFLVVIFASQKEIYAANHAYRYPQCWPPVELSNEDIEVEDEETGFVPKERWENPDYDPMDDPLRKL